MAPNLYFHLKIIPVRALCITVLFDKVVKDLATLDRSKASRENPGGGHIFLMIIASYFFQTLGEVCRSFCSARWQMRKKFCYAWQAEPWAAAALASPQIQDAPCWENKCFAIKMKLLFKFSQLFIPVPSRRYETMVPPGRCWFSFDGLLHCAQL